MMGDYIRGKAAYTKWDADGEAENIDIEYRPNGQQTPTQEGWLSGRKGIVIKVLLLLLLFSAGLMVGYLLRRGIGLRNVFHHGHSSHPSPAHYIFLQETADKLEAEISAENIRNFLKNYTSEPHIAGKLPSQLFVNYTEELWKSWGLDDVNIEKFTVLLSYPSSNEANQVRLVNGNGTATHAFASEIGDDAGIHPDLRPYLAYSPNATATGKLVYANYGQREDFEYLLSQNVTINGAVVIMRLGKLHRTNKIKFAEEYDAVGALLYPDPADYVHEKKYYPHGVDLPGDSVIRGSLSWIPGDPQTPTQAATDNAFHLPRWKLKHLPQIPVQPISYNNAQRFMAEMDGPDAPPLWQGDLPIKYKLGPGHIVNNNSDWVVTMNIYNELKQTEIFNVVGAIIGTYEPDRYVIVGNHHDSWTNGTGDPGTGLAAFMEMVRAFGRLKAHGWRPGRTIIFACWDAEEFGMIGSTEWIQMHNKELASRAVAYINTDAGIQGRDILQAFGSPLLKRVVHEATNIVSFPVEDGQHKKSVYTQWKAISGVDNRFDLASGPTLGILGYGSDYAAFMSMYGISSLHLQFVSKNNNSSYPLYHSAHDNFDAVDNFIDHDFEMSRTLANLVGVVVLKLSDGLTLPMDIEDYGYTLNESFANFNATYGAMLKDMDVSLDKMEQAVEDFNLATKLMHNDFSLVNQNDELLTYHECNDRILEFERAFMMPHWEQPMGVLRHIAFGPHPHNIEEGVAFPLLVDAILEAQGHNETRLINRIRWEVTQVIQGLESAAGVLEHSIFSFYKQNLKDSTV